MYCFHFWGCRGLPGTPGAWLQLWQTVTFMFLESKMPHFLLGCEPEGVVVAGLEGGMEETCPPPPPVPVPLHPSPSARSA